MAYDYDYTIVNIFLARKIEKLRSFKFHFTITNAEIHAGMFFVEEMSQFYNNIS